MYPNSSVAPDYDVGDAVPKLGVVVHEGGTALQEQRRWLVVVNADLLPAGDLPCGATFPYPREVGLCNVIIKPRDLNILVVVQEPCAGPAAKFVVDRRVDVVVH
jgi:hypothetical protein